MARVRLRAGRREGREQQRDHEGVVSKATTRARVRRRRRRRRRLARARVAARHRARRRNGVTRGTRRERRDGSRRCRFCSHARRGGRESKPPFLAETFPRAEARAESYSAPASPVCREKKTLARLGRAERTSDASPPLATRTRAGAPRRRRSTHHRAFRRETFARNDERTRPAWLPRLHPRLAG